MTDELTEQPPSVAAWSDEAVALRLRDTNMITGSQYDAFIRRKGGETFPHIARTGPLNPLTGRHYDRTAIEDWFGYVVEQIRLVRELRIPIDEDRTVWGIWIDQSHLVRLAPNDTPAYVGRATADQVPGSHFPDAERMKASGKKPR